MILRQLLLLDLRTLYRPTAKTTPEGVQHLVFSQLSQCQTLSYADLQTLLQEERQEPGFASGIDKNLTVLAYRRERFTGSITKPT